jgi:hypothetical protein
MRRVLNPRYLGLRRMGAVGIALTAWDIWRHLPPEQRRRITREARKHAPTVARAVARQIRLARDARRNWHN